MAIIQFMCRKLLRKRKEVERSADDWDQCRLVISESPVRVLVFSVDSFLSNQIKKWAGSELISQINKPNITSLSFEESVWNKRSTNIHHYMN